MIRVLQSSWLTALIGCLLYLGTTLVLFRASQFSTGKTAPVHRSADEDPSWRFKNPDLDQWISQMKEEKEAIATREQQLNEWQARLDAEHLEISTVTQTVAHLQAAFDSNVVHFTTQQAVNLKRQVKLIKGMTPAGAVGLLKEMPDDDVVRLLFAMKTDDASALLENMSALGAPEAKRAALITTRLHEVLPDPTNTLSSTSP